MTGERKKPRHSESGGVWNAKTKGEKGEGFHIPAEVKDTLIFIGQWLVVTVGIFAWWMGLQLIISLFAVNVWHVTFDQILWRSVWLTAACSVGYLVIMIRRERRKRQ